MMHESYNLRHKSLSERIDSYLLDKCINLSQFTERNIGINAAALERMLFGISAVSFGSYAVDEIAWPIALIAAKPIYEIYKSFNDAGKKLKSSGLGLTMYTASAVATLTGLAILSSPQATNDNEAIERGSLILKFGLGILAYNTADYFSQARSILQNKIRKFVSKI